VSVESRKREAEDADMARRVLQLARDSALIRRAVPVAKTTGMAARDGARSAATWAAPRVNGARAWAAPRIERSGLAIKDTVAPKISEMFVITARRLDVPAPRRRLPKVMAGTAVLAAVGAAVAVVLRRRANGRTGEAPEEAADEGSGPEIAPEGQPGAEGRGAEADVNR
jgi:hypothetical protein